MRPFVPAWLSTAEAEEGFARSYDAQFDEVYRRNPVGQRAVRLVAGMLGALTIDAIDGDEGVTTYVRSSSVWATFRSGAWELGVLRGSNVTISGQQVLGGRAAAIPGPSGGGVIDVEARSAVGQILTALRLHGLIET